VKTKQSFSPFFCKWQRKSPARLAGLFCLLIFANSCQTATTPEEITIVFWEELTRGNVETAKKYATQDTQHLVTQQQAKENSTLEIGQITINGLNANVQTIITLPATDHRPLLAFDTVLLKKEDQWQVDYRQTLNNISNEPLNEPFSGIFKSLQDIGETFNKQLEQQMPLIEKEIDSFGEILKQQLEEFGRALKNFRPPAPPEKQQPYGDTI
jgi:DNA anti-recombination protein RmuC